MTMPVTAACIDIFAFLQEIPSLTELDLNFYYVRSTSKFMSMSSTDRGDM